MRAGRRDAALRPAARPTRSTQLQRLGRPAAAAQRQRLVERHAWSCACAAPRAAVAAALRAARRRASIADDSRGAFWDGLRDQRDAFFIAAAEPPSAQDARCGACRCRRPRRVLAARPATTLIEWDGAQRWLVRRRRRRAGARRGRSAPAATRRFSRAAAASATAPASTPLRAAAAGASTERLKSDRSIRTASSIRGRLYPRPLSTAPHADRHSLPNSPARPTAARPRRSCASACTAASAPPPARPTSCSATSSTARAAAST